MALELELELEDELETAFTTFARRKDMRSSRFSLIEVLTLAMRISSTLSSVRDHWSPPVNDRIIANVLSHATLDVGLLEYQTASLARVGYLASIEGWDQ